MNRIILTAVELSGQSPFITKLGGLLTLARSLVNFAKLESAEDFRGSEFHSDSIVKLDDVEEAEKEVTEKEAQKNAVEEDNAKTTRDKAMDSVLLDDLNSQHYASCSVLFVFITAKQFIDLYFLHKVIVICEGT